MSEPTASPNPPAGASRHDLMAALFASMVVQQTNTALMFLGKVPHPDSGQTTLDLDAAQMFIDQLEMLEVKTRGNLSKPEEDLLRQNLMALRMTFVEAVEGRDMAPSSDAPQAATATPEAARPAAPAEAESDSRKKFTKKY